MSFEDFFQVEILLRSGVEPVYSLLNLIHFRMYALTFPWEIAEIAIIIWLAFLSLLSPLETPVSLAADYSKYPRIVAGRTSKWLEYPRDSNTHSSRDSSAKTIQHFRANPASYAGQGNACRLFQ